MKPRTKCLNRQGFSLVEMVIVIGVLAILVTISTPSIFEYLRFRDRQTEENNLIEVRKALQAYLADRNRLPDEATWSTDLSGYTNLSTAQIANDTWNKPRTFLSYTDPTRNLQGTNVSIFYVSIHSKGSDGVATASPGISVDAAGEFNPTTESDWWKNMAGAQVTTFSSLQSGGDDMMIRFTDYPEKIERYNLTLQRLDRVAKALESFAKNGYANRIVYCGGLTRDPASGLTGEANCDNGTPERIVYYPKSTAIADVTDNATYENTSIYVDNGQTDPLRRSSMQGLMRLLGLPDDFCCSALLLGSDELPKPFYYFSNPRPRNASGGCGVRPDAATLKLPARITSTNDDTALTNPTCG